MRCFGHIAIECSRPEGKDKCKPKGNGIGKGWCEGKGKATGGKGSVVRSHCQKPGHPPERCFILHPELRRKSAAYQLDEEAAEADEMGCGLLELCSVEQLRAPVNLHNRFMSLRVEDD